jgi:hypothetical protein
MNTKKYYTEEEKQEALRRNARNYYWRHREKINKKQREYRAIQKAEKAATQKPKKIRAKTLPTYDHISINGKSYLLHRWLWEKYNGPIPSGYIVHHINGDINDNRLENLLCVSPKQHAELHKNMKSNGNAYYSYNCKKWVENNREKWNEYQAEYKRQRRLIMTDEEKQKEKEYHKKRYEENREAMKKKYLDYYYMKKETDPEWYENNKAKRRALYQLKKKQKENNAEICPLCKVKSYKNENACYICFNCGYTDCD